MRILLVVYDNDSYIHHFPIGLAYIAAVLQNEGIDVEIWSQDLHHYSDQALTDFLDKEKFDMIGVSVIAGYYQYRKLLSLSEAINRSKNRPIFILGGHGPTPDPEYFIKKTNADIIVMGEGEDTAIELVRSIAAKNEYSKIKGIAYRNKQNTVIINERRPLIHDIDNIPFPAYDLFPVYYYRLFRTADCSNSDFVLPILSGRGCTFKCNFCYRMDEGYRPRSCQSIVEEIKYLQREYNITRISFADELLMISSSRTEDICRAFLKAKLNIKWGCNGRLNFATPDLLRLMKIAGCVSINYGIESVDDQALKNMNKALTVKQIHKGIESTLDAGINPICNIIFGNIGENIQILQKGVDFLLKYDTGVQLRTIRPVTPYPGSDLFYYAIEEGLLKDSADFYENKHVNSDLLTVNFTNLTDEAFHQALCEANTTLINNHIKKKRNSLISQTENLYLNKDVNFRGYRQT